jgi:hypothetical protein
VLCSPISLDGHIGKGDHIGSMSSDNDLDDTEYVGGDEELEDADVDEQEEDRAIKPSKTKAKKSRLRKSKKSELVDDAAASDEDDEVRVRLR